MKNFRAGIDVFPEAVLVHDGKTYLYANPAAAALLGASSPDIIVGRPVLSVVPERDHERVAGRVDQVIAGTPTERADLRFVRIDGSEVDVAVTGAPITLENGSVAAIVVARDISDRVALQRELETNAARFRKLVENAFDVIVTLDENGRVTYVSRTTETLLGYAPSDLHGRDLYRLIHEEDKADALRRFRAVAAGASRMEVTTLRLLRSDSRWCAVEGIAVNMLGDPDVRSIVINARDITDRLRIAEQLDQMRRVESLGQVASTVSHEFNNVLMSISPFIELLKRLHANDAQTVKHLEYMKNALTRGRQIVNEIRQFGRPLELKRETIEVESWLHETMAGLRPMLPSNIDMKLCASGVLHVTGDRDLLTQVVTNLILNARDALSQGGRIDVESRRLWSSHDDLPQWIEMRIRDNGPGIEDEVRKRLFEPFFTTKKSGTGLGLSICQRIVAAHDGRLQVESELGHGSTFSILLPAQRRERGS